MMRSKYNIDGYTLLELMITILIGSIITLATTTILLLGLRLNNESNATVEKQNTVRVLLTALEDLATEGEINSIEYTTYSWKIIGEDATNPIFSYDAEKKIIYTGRTSESPLLEDVIASHVMMDENGLLTFSIETDDGIYSSSVFCRTAKQDEVYKDEEVNSIVQETNTIVTTEARKAFLKVLASQYGSHGYVIPNEALGIKVTGSSGLQYYSDLYNSSWDLDTPWCAIFISWAVAQDNIVGVGDSQTNVGVKQYINTLPVESHVSKYVEYIEGKGEYTGKESTWTDNPQPGDLVIFDWDKEKDNGPDHIGVVLKIENNILYTIEGNTANMVAVRSYKTTDPDIVGYGVLDWKTNP